MVQAQETERIAAELDALRARVARLEGAVLPRPAPRPARVVVKDPPAPCPVVPPPPVAPPAPRRSLEDRLGGQVLAWVGGAAVLLGIVFFLALATANGWIGEGARATMGAGFSLALVGLGAWLRDRRARTEAALAATGAGLGGLFVTVTVATQVYDLLPPAAGTAIALAVGAGATTLAVRWRAQAIGALGVLGALLAPVLAGAPSDGATIALVLVASASAAGVLVWQRWDWLALAAFAAATPQWCAWIAHGQAPGTAVAVLSAFGALTVATAIGFELRCRTARLRGSSAFLLAANALVLAAAGWLALEGGGHGLTARLWLVALAAVHAAVGLGAGRLRRVSHEIGMEALALGVVLADLVLAAVADGPVLTVGWAASAVGFAALGRFHARRAGDRELAVLALGGHVALALGHALVVDAPPGAGLEGFAAAASLAAVAAACLTSARLADGPVRQALDAVGLAVVAYLAALSLDGAALSAAWAVEAVALMAIARQSRDDVAAWGALAHLTGGLVLAVTTLAPPAALVDGLTRPLGAALALGAVGLAALRCARAARAQWRTPLLCAGALVLLYLASCAIVTPFAQGQVLLSALWGACGVAALVAGLWRRVAPLRHGALALLLVTVAKVFLYDLSTLESIYRAASFVALGLLLLGGAFAWQQLRPATSSHADARTG